MASDLPNHLYSLTKREAIADRLYRALNGLDNHDRALFDSAFLDSDETMYVTQDKETKGMQALHDMLDTVGAKTTLHMTSNIRIETGYDSGTRAKLTCNALNQHFSTARGKNGVGSTSDDKGLTVGGQYVVDLVLDGNDGLWKIEKWVFNVLWSQGDRSLL